MAQFGGPRRIGLVGVVALVVTAVAPPAGGLVPSPSEKGSAASYLSAVGYTDGSTTLDRTLVAITA